MVQLPHLHPPRTKYNYIMTLIFSSIVIGKQVKVDDILRIKDVMIIRYVHSWGGNIADRKWWEGSINGEVEDWNSPKQLIKQAEIKGLPWLILRYHKNGLVSCVEKGNGVIVIPPTHYSP
jgi:hypothetical protein